jgi:diaminopimelate decarboxylase/L-glutamyl-[BtrI acyl-carrier protein] decarboxylase
MKKEDFYAIIPKADIRRVVDESDLPVFLYSRRIIEKKYDELAECLPKGFEIHYAFKANPNREVLEILRSLGLGADVASHGELRLARQIGFSPEKIEFTGPGKTLEELSMAIDFGISSINVESVSEIRKIADLCRQKDKTANVGIRVNPKAQSSAAAMKMGGDAQFGVIEDDLAEAFSFLSANKNRIHFTGLHMHLGSQFLDAERLISNFRFILEKACDIAARYGVKIAKLNYGGGWGIDMFGKKPPLDLTTLKHGLSDLFDEPVYGRILENIRLIVEPGRFLVAECGLYAVEVLYRKKGYQREFLIVNGGMHQHYSAAGGIGQVIRRNYEIDVLSDNEQDGKTVHYTVTGSLCIPDDILATELVLHSQISEGDVLLFFNSGAYAFTASPLHFLSHSFPREIIL